MFFCGIFHKLIGEKNCRICCKALNCIFMNRSTDANKIKILAIANNKTWDKK